MTNGNSVTRTTVLLVGLATAVQFAAGQNRKSWVDYGGGADNSHFTALTEIDKTNVGQLEVAWSYAQGSTGFNPIVAGNVIYVLSAGNSLTALDAATGKEIWIHANLAGITSRGINYWESKDHKDRRLIFSISNFLQEIDANSGKSILTFGKDGFVDLREGLGREPASIGRIQSNTPGKVFENLVILGSAPGEAFLAPPGDLRAFNVITGKLEWQFHTIPHPGEYGYDTVPKDGWKYLGGGNTWGEITVDEKRGIAYFPLGSLTYDFYGADRPGADLYGDCLLALDARTGKRLWHYQMVHHDLWDYDNTSAPQLITVKKDGRTVEAVAQAGKTGFLYVFDRVTGQPLWPIEERPVPKSDVPGEKAWPTQPFPTAPPPFSRQKFTVDDISPYLPDEERAAIRDQILSARNDGIFTPPSFRGTVSMPGNQGGSNWGTTAADPAKGIVYVLNVDEPAYLKLDKDPPISGGNGILLGLNRAGRGGAGTASSPGQTLYTANCQGCHGDDRNGSASVPSLVSIVMRIPADAIKATVTGGKGQMPAFANLAGNDLNVLIAYLANPNGGGRAGGGRGRGRAGAGPPAGPVVESGVPPAAQQAAAAMAEARASATNYGNMQGPPYPSGIDSPADRFFSGWGVSENAIGGPFSTLVAYDLNKGTIKWRVPVGDDPQLLKQGVTGTGARSLRTGIIPTAAGLVFLAGGDGKIRAYDEDTGKVLWEKPIGGASRGIPVMYEANGREYLVVSAARGGGRGMAPPDAAAASDPADAASPAAPTGYVAFALPEKPAKAK